MLAAMSLVLGVACLASTAHPLADGAPRGLLSTVGLLATLGAVALARTGRPLGPVALNAAVVGLTLLRGVIVAGAAGERGSILAAFGFSWTAVYVAFFLPAAVARAHAALITGVLGVALLLARAPTDPAVWAWIAATVWTAVLILTRVNALLRQEGRVDPLTGLLNRAGFAVEAGRARRTALRHGEPVTLAMVDLDGFKVVNDRLGHPAGDRLLCELAAVWTTSLRPSDVIGRFGGDEFVLLLPGLDEAGARGVLERLESAHPVRWTAGTASCAPEEPLDAAMARADERLCAAKAARRSAAPAPRERLEPR